MCSIGWEWIQKNASSTRRLKLFFNRDEQRNRALAIPPKIHSKASIQSIFPIDPVGGGTWFSVNNHGIVIALLNYYESPHKPLNPVSRGILVKSLSFFSDSNSLISALQAELKTHNKTKGYSPFSLFIFDTNQQTHHCFQWDCCSLKKHSTASQFFSSSSWNTQEVLAYRDTLYQSHVINEGAPLEKFNKMIIQGKQEWSVCMERELTQTVSHIELEISDNEASLTYIDRVNKTTHLSSLAVS